MAAVAKSSKSKNAQKPSLPDTDIPSIPADILYQIMPYLQTRDILKCMRVCKLWKVTISEKYLWKMVINNHFDLTLMSDVKDERPFGMWSDPEEWFCYYDNEDDAYVMRPFPSMWKCGVIHPFGLNPMEGDAKSLQGFCRSLEILTYMRSKARKYYIASGNECSANEGCDDICVVLFPWNKNGLPSGTTILKDTFHVHPEIYDVYAQHGDDEIRTEKLFYHLPVKGMSDEDYEEEAEHDVEEKPCLNRIFGFTSHPIDEGECGIEEITEFYAWLQNIMVPTTTIYGGIDKLNPVIVFFITNLAPGWVGGVLTGVNYT